MPWLMEDNESRISPPHAGCEPHQSPMVIRQVEGGGDPMPGMPATVPAHLTGSVVGRWFWL